MPQDCKTQTDFYQRYNISYSDPKLPRATLRQALHHYAASVLIYGVVLLFIRINPWFCNLLGIKLLGYPAMVLYYYAYAAYLVITPMVFFIIRPRSLWASKNLQIVKYLGRLLRWCIRSGTHQMPNAYRPTYEEKHAMMFLLIKTFYGPLMINSALSSYNMMLPILRQLGTHRSLLDICDNGYMLLFYAVFLLDSTMFAVGYHSESALLGNKLRYAETNPLHILVCVACYGPFNMATGALFGPSNQNPYIVFCGSLMHPVTWILRALAVFFLLLLVSASLSLFTRASNLTNRGIVDWGPYRIIRHPGYLAKNMFWLMTLIPVFAPNKADPRFTWPAYLLFCATIVWGFIGWGTLYFLRAITEERFLMRDPDYVAYCQKVKYRFIPGVY
jgi:protein-S-isoprenylcysteine O-methyltransferase Ste14